MVVVFCFCWAPYASFAMINILGHGKVGNNDELQARAKASLNILTSAEEFVPKLNAHQLSCDVERSTDF